MSINIIEIPSSLPPDLIEFNYSSEVPKAHKSKLVDSIW